MGLLSSSVSISRYSVEKGSSETILEIVRKGLKKNTISEIEDEYAEISIGWVPFDHPFEPDFETFPFVFGNDFIFSIRIDKKSIPSKMIQKFTAIEIAKKLKESKRDFISKQEKTDIKDRVIEMLMRQIPSTPSVYDALWDFENNSVFLYTTQKAANELFETLFYKSFSLKIIRKFPFTIIEKSNAFTSEELDRVSTLSPLKFAR